MQRAHTNSNTLVIIAMLMVTRSYSIRNTKCCQSSKRHTSNSNVRFRTYFWMFSRMFSMFPHVRRFPVWSKVYSIMSVGNTKWLQVPGATYMQQFKRSMKGGWGRGHNMLQNQWSISGKSIRARAFRFWTHPILFSVSTHVLFMYKLYI